MATCKIKIIFAGCDLMGENALAIEKVSLLAKTKCLFLDYGKIKKNLCSWKRYLDLVF